MCGIVGYVGGQDASSILIEGLHRLEYRGYDSAGVAVLNGGAIQLRRAPGIAIRITTAATAERNPATCHAVNAVALMAAPPVENRNAARNSNSRLRPRADCVNFRL